MAVTSTRIEFSEILGRRVRLGDWQDQKISTYRKIREALEGEDWAEAARLAHYFVDEAEVVFGIYRHWIPDLQAFIRENGVPAEEVAAIDADVMGRIKLPDGTPFNRYRQWDRLRGEVEQFVALCHRERREEALAQLERFKETWRQTHDRDVDHTYGLMSAIKERFGEAAIGRMWEKVLVPLFVWRYEKFDISKHPWDEGLEHLMLVACEAMRGHLVGPERTGDMELIEEADRYIIRFDPCGSGGRTVRGDWTENTPPRMEPPYNWTVSEEPHPWNHFQTGVCHYCTHCIALMEIMPIDNFGYPLRVINPPRYPDTDRDPAVRQKCSWTMYKDPTQIPEEVYRLSGRTKSGKFGSREVGAPPLPDVSTGGMPGQG